MSNVIITNYLNLLGFEFLFLSDFYLNAYQLNQIQLEIWWNFILDFEREKVIFKLIAERIFAKINIQTPLTMRFPNIEPKIGPISKRLEWKLLKIQIYGVLYYVNADGVYNLFLRAFYTLHIIYDKSNVWKAER